MAQEVRAAQGGALLAARSSRISSVASSSSPRWTGVAIQPERGKHCS
ncbi:hypothetical protein [Streptomyces sp. NPDC007905]